MSPPSPALLAEGFRFDPGSLPWIHLAWLIPALLLLYLYSFYQKRVALRVFASSEVLGHLIPSVSGARQYWKCALVLAGVLALVAAMARPQWGTDLEVINRRGIDLVVLLDLSKSMLAEDVPPNRLEWAKADLSELLGGLSGDRVALVPFAGRAEVRCPLTFDYGFFRRVLGDLRVGSVGLGGTSIGAAIHKGLECFQDNVRNHKAILLITDGEDHEAYVKEAAEKARERGVRIFSIGVGDTGEGKRIPITDAQGNRVYLQDKDGKEVWSKMDPRVLLQAGQVTDGGYAPAYLRKEGDTTGAMTTVRDIYAKIAEKVTKKELEGAKEERYQDRYQWFLAAAWILLALEPLVRTRRRLPSPATPTPSARGPAARAESAPAGGRRMAAAAGKGAGAAVLLAGAILFPSDSAAAADYGKLLLEGNRLYAQKDYAAAEEKYLAARTERQDAAEVSYNIANTHFQREDFPKAIELYGEALKEARDRELETRIRYNLACARARESERFVSDLANQENLQKGVDLLREAIGGFRDVLEIDHRHQNAQKNLAIAQLRVKSLLDELKRLREEAEKKAREEKDQKKSPVEILKQLIEEEKAEIELTAGAGRSQAEKRTLSGFGERLGALGEGPRLAAGLKEILADPGFAVGGAEASEALKLGESGDAAGALRKLGESRERIQKEISARDEAIQKSLEKDRTDQALTMGRTVGLARGLRDLAEGKAPPPAAQQPPTGAQPPPPPPPPKPPPPEVADRLVAVAQLSEEANSKMAAALGALGEPAGKSPPAPSGSDPQAKEEAGPPPTDLEKAGASQRSALELLEKALAEAEKLPKEEPPPQEDKQDQQKDQQKDQNKDQKKDQEKDQQKKEDDQKKDQEKGEGKKDDKKKDQGKEGGKADDTDKDKAKKDEKKMSKEEAEQALRKFLEKDADRRRDKERRAAGAGPGRAALDKDW